MKNLLITKASSRLGMKYIPSGGTVLNLGVEKGPEAVLTSEFIQEISQENEVDLFDYAFSDPDPIAPDTYYPVIAEESAALANDLVEKLTHKKYSGLITVGGDHSIAYGSMLGVLRFLEGKKVGVIDFDSHGDIHLKGTSPTGNFHGMWLRPFFDTFDDSSIASVIDVQVIPAEQFLYIGNLILETEEARFIQEKNISIINSSMIDTDASAMMKKIADFCESVEVVHVTFDIDVFKKDIVSATGTPNPNGFETNMIKSCIKPIVDSKKLFSMELVEVNPTKEGGAQTIATAQMVIREFLDGFHI